MKKIFTFLLGLAFCLSGFAAVKVAPKADFKLNPEMCTQVIKKDLADIAAGKAVEELYTRSWTDGQGFTWQLSLKYSGLTILNFLNEEGQAMWKDEIMYVPQFQLVKLNKAGNGVTDGVIMYLFWPSMYWYDQIYTYEGEVDGEGMIPVDKRDFAIVPPSVLINDATHLRMFQETGNIYNVANNQITSWGILPMEIGGAAMLNGQNAESASTETNPATLDFKSFDLTEGTMDMRFTIPLAVGTTTGTLAGNFTGEADVEGFEPRYIKTQPMTDIHLFNGGKISEEILGDETPFTAIFDGEFTQFYLAACPEVGQVGWAEGMKAFDPNGIGFRFLESAQNKDINCYQGFLFADAKYADDTTLDPSDMTFYCKDEEWEYNPILEQGYWTQAPALNTFVTYGASDTWSDEYGFRVASEGYYQFVINPSNIQWGTTAGLVINMQNQYFRYISSAGTGDIVYHYDSSDISKTRTFTSVGTREPSAVKNVAADAFDAKVIARNGMISVVAGEKAPIAVFTLDGKLVKAAKAAELSVEAPKGMYVVRVGNTAKKVVL